MQGFYRSAGLYVAASLGGISALMAQRLYLDGGRFRPSVLFSNATLSDLGNSSLLDWSQPTPWIQDTPIIRYIDGVTGGAVQAGWHNITIARDSIDAAISKNMSFNQLYKVWLYSCMDLQPICLGLIHRLGSWSLFCLFWLHRSGMCLDLEANHEALAI